MKPVESSRLRPIRESAIRKFVQIASNSKDVVHLEQGEPSFTTPEHISNAAITAVKEGFTHYGPTAGLEELRQAIAEKLTRENRIPVDGPQDVLVVSGTQEAMFLAALTFLNVGDEALILAPYYPVYFQETLIAGAKPVTVPLSEDSHYRIDAKFLQQYVTSKTKMVWLNTPANPTGHVFSRKDLEAVAAVARENNLLIFSDEVYEKLVYEGSEHISIGSLPGMKDLVITANGFSKSYAMTGWRIGYVSAQEELLDQMSKLHYYTVLCPSTIAQKAALAALTGPQDCILEMVLEYDKGRMAILEVLDKIGVTYVRPKGAFYVFPNISRFNENDEAVAEILLREFGVATVPGSGFGTEGTGYLRMSFSAPIKQLEKGIDRLQRAFEYLSSHKASKTSR